MITRQYTSPKKQSLFPMLLHEADTETEPLRSHVHPNFVKGLDRNWVRDSSGTIVEYNLKGSQWYDDNNVVGELSLAVPTKFKSANTPLYLSK